MNLNIITYYDRGFLVGSVFLILLVFYDVFLLLFGLRSVLCPMFPVSLACPFLVVPSGFSTVYITWVYNAAITYTLSWLPHPVHCFIPYYYSSWNAYIHKLCFIQCFINNLWRLVLYISFQIISNSVVSRLVNLWHN